MKAFIHRIARALVALQLDRPVLVLALALASAVLAGLAAHRLDLRTGLGELLPQGKESVAVAERVNERLVSASTLAIVAEGEDKQALERFVDELAPEIRALGPEVVGNVDAGVRPARAFFEAHALLYAPLDDLQRAHDDLLARFAFEVSRAQGGFVDESDPPPPIGDVEKRLRGEESEANERYPDGYYLDDKSSPKRIALLVHTPVSSGDLDAAKVFLARIDAAIAKVGPARIDPKMVVGKSGDFITSSEEYEAIKGDLTHVGVVGVLLVLSVVFVFYLRARMLLALGLTIGVGVLWSFAFASFSVAHLNSSTALLVSILVGNGINFGIVYMARYMEARRTADLPTSVRTASRETWRPTLVAACSALTAYGSLAVTEFRGFKHFGLLGGVGMLLCWLATYLVLPPLLVAFERVLPIKPSTGLAAKIAGSYGRPFAWIVTHWPRAVVAAGALVGIASVVLAVRYVEADPMEYDLRNIRSDSPEYESNARRLAGILDGLVGSQGQEGVAILVDRIEQVLPLAAALEARRDAAKEGHRPFDKVVTIFDLLPKDQPERIALAAEVKDRLERAKRLHFVDDAVYEKASARLTPQALGTIGVGDLPEQVARAFTEKDGTRGRLVYIVPAEGRSVWDARYLFEWADAFRSTTLPDGSVVKGSGRSVVFADLVAAVMQDAPRAIALSALGTVAVVFIAFRRRSAPVLGAIAIGIAAMIAFLALRGMKLNFLNFIALPISIGIGADYAVNVGERLRSAEGMDQIHKAVVETGGAVILCSMTTTLSYLALTVSVNLAIKSFGIAAAAGEVACIVAAVLVLPAWAAVRSRRRPAP